MLMQGCVQYPIQLMFSGVLEIAILVKHLQRFNTEYRQGNGSTDIAPTANFEFKIRMTTQNPRQETHGLNFVNLLVVLNHLPYDIQFSFMPNGHVAVNVKYT